LTPGSTGMMAASTIPFVFVKPPNAMASPANGTPVRRATEALLEALYGLIPPSLAQLSNGRPPGLRDPCVFIFGGPFGGLDSIVPGIVERVPFRIAIEQVVARIMGIVANDEGCR